MIHIVTDSCADLTPELIDKYQIEVVRMPVFIDERSFMDGLDIELATLFSLVQKTGKLPKTSAPSVAQFLQAFDRTEEIIYIGISSQLSAAHSNALLASQSLDGHHSIRIIDSLNLSSGIGLLVLKAAELRGQGCNAEEIEQEITGCIPHVHSSFIVDTLDYIYMGGRCSSIEHIFGSLLKIRPVIAVRPDGTLGVREKTRSTRRKTLENMLVEFKDHIDSLDLHRVFVTHTGCDQDAAYLAAELKQLAPIDEILVSCAGATIASHCGPDTIGILYLTDH